MAYLKLHQGFRFFNLGTELLFSPFPKVNVIVL